MFSFLYDNHTAKKYFKFKRNDIIRHPRKQKNMKINERKTEPMKLQILELIVVDFKIPC